LPFIFGAGETLGNWIAGRSAPKLPACHTLSEIVPERYSTEQYEAAGMRHCKYIAIISALPIHIAISNRLQIDFSVWREFLLCLPTAGRLLLMVPFLGCPLPK